MERDEVRLAPNEVSEDARRYLAALEAEQDHPFVREHFHQVTWLSLVLPNQVPIEFFALEFRDGLNASLIWEDDRGHWGAGSWLRLAHRDADITCPPSPLSLAYFQGVQAHASLPSALALLAATKPD